MASTVFTWVTFTGSPQGSFRRFSFTAKLWDVKPVLPQACSVSSGFPCSPREHILPLVQDFLWNFPLKSLIFSLFWNSSPKSFIPSFGNPWVEVLGTPAYFKLLPDEYLLYAYDLSVEFLRVVLQNGHKWGNQLSRLRQLSQSDTACKWVREYSNPASSVQRPCCDFLLYFT